VIIFASARMISRKGHFNEGDKIGTESSK